MGYFYGSEIEVDHLGIKMAIFERIEKFYVLQKVSI